jgi:hypothetical protein
MARKVQIEVDTTLNYCRITDSDTTSGEVNFDFFGVIGYGFSYERESSTLALTNANALIKLKTPTGETGFFKIAELDYFKIDGVAQVNATLSALITNVAPYIFTA